MILIILIIIFVISFSTFILYNNYSFQVFIRTNLRKKQIKLIALQTSGIYLKLGYFSSSRKVILNSEFSNLLIRQKADMIKCYSITTFKTVDATWELFFTLTKDSGRFIENIYLKCYPYNLKIHSKVAIEKIHSKLEIYATNYSLMQILNSRVCMSNLNSILTLNEETLNIGVRCLQYKGNLNFENISKTKILHKISHINEVKNQIYVPGIKSY
jgi:hypothetical protein